MAAHSNLDDIDDEFVELELLSDWGKSSVHDSLVHNEEFKLAARSYVRENAYKKGEPNMTVCTFKQWIYDKFNVEVCLETARLYLYRLGFKQCDHKKGIFFDGHEREDVAYRGDFIMKISELDAITNSCQTREAFHKSCA